MLKMDQIRIKYLFIYYRWQSGSEDQYLIQKQERENE